MKLINQTRRATVNRQYVMSKTLQQKIDELTKEQSFKEFATTRLGEIKHLAFLSGHDKEIPRLVITTTTLTEVQFIFTEFPATNITTEIGIGTKHEVTLSTPYRINIDNPARPSQYRDFTVEIHYFSSEIDIEIDIPLSLIPDFFIPTKRNISDSEYHHFTGVSINELRSLKIRTYDFKGEQIKWYGGDRTLIDVPVIQSIITTVTKS